MLSNIDVPYITIDNGDGTYTIEISRDSTRIDLLDAVALTCFWLDDEACYSQDSATYRWRWLCDEVIQALSEDTARDVLEYVARMHDVTVEWID